MQLLLVGKRDRSTCHEESVLGHWHRALSLPFFCKTESVPYCVSLGHVISRLLRAGRKLLLFPPVPPQKGSPFSEESTKIKIMAKTWNKIFRFVWQVWTTLSLWGEISCVLQDHSSSAFTSPVSRRSCASQTESLFACFLRHERFYHTGKCSTS